MNEKFCKDCRFIDLDTYCRHPSNGINLVSGTPVAYMACFCRKASEARHPGSPYANNGCGPEGYLFEKRKEITYWRRIWEWLKGN